MLPAANPQARLYLIAYDIRDKKRLARVAKCCGKAAMRLQDSLYCAQLSETMLSRLQARLASLIDAEADDLRVYTVPQYPFGAWCGPDPETFDKDVFLLGSGPESFILALKQKNLNMRRTNNE
jgi:CRISPR-associated protein Cas2